MDYLLLIADNEQKLSTLKYKLDKKLPSNHFSVATDLMGIKLVHTEGSVTIFQTKFSDVLVRTLGLK